MNILGISVLFLSVYYAKPHSLTADPETLQRIDASLSRYTTQRTISPSTEEPSWLGILSHFEDLPIFNKYKKLDSQELEVPSKTDLEISVPLVGANIGRNVERHTQVESNVDDEYIDETDAIVEYQGDNKNFPTEKGDLMVEQNTFFEETSIAPSNSETTTIDGAFNKFELGEVEFPSTTPMGIPTTATETVEKETEEMVSNTEEPKSVEKAKNDLKMKVLLLKGDKNKIRKYFYQTTTETIKPSEENFKNLMAVKVVLKNEGKPEKINDCSRCNDCKHTKMLLREILQREDSELNNALEIVKRNSLSPEYDDCEHQKLMRPKTRCSRGTGDTQDYVVTPAPLIPRALTNLLPTPKIPQLLERLESESSVEKAERLNEGLQRLMQFVSIMAQIDSFVTSRARSTIKKLAHLYAHEEYPLGYNLRAKNPDSFT